jgi:hypothetical protein
MVNINEVFTDYLRYIKDTEATRRLLSEKFEGEMLISEEHTYIIFNTTSKTWRPSFDFEWLYRKTPTLTTIDELFAEFK